MPKLTMRRRREGNLLKLVKASKVWGQNLASGCSESKFNLLSVLGSMGCKAHSFSSLESGEVGLSWRKDRARLYYSHVFIPT